MTKPISPDQVGRTKRASFPPEVFEAFNNLVARHFIGHSATFKQSDVVNAIVEAMQTETPYGNNGAEIEELIFKRGWLNVEETYRELGWTVKYDKPGYDESYEPTFTFSKG